MQKIEKIPVYIRVERGKTVCLCPRNRKACKRPCEKDTVTRDVFEGWEQTMKRDRYGK